MSSIPDIINYVTELVDNVLKIDNSTNRKESNLEILNHDVLWFKFIKFDCFLFVGFSS